METINNLESIRTYLNKNKNEIMQTYKAHGVAIGKEDPNDMNYIIVVYLDSKSQIPTEPVMRDGIPLKFIATGPFNIQT